jgi:hypothetical protein
VAQPLATIAAMARVATERRERMDIKKSAGDVELEPFFRRGFDPVLHHLDTGSGA